MRIEKKQNRIVVRDFDTNEDGNIANIDVAGLDFVEMHADVAFFDILDEEHWYICKLDGIGQTEYCLEAE